MLHAFGSDELGRHDQQGGDGSHGDEHGAHAERFAEEPAEESTDWHGSPADEPEGAVDASEHGVGCDALAVGD